MSAYNLGKRKSLKPVLSESRVDRIDASTLHLSRRGALAKVERFTCHAGLLANAFGVAPWRRWNVLTFPALLLTSHLRRLAVALCIGGSLVTTSIAQEIDMDANGPVPSGSANLPTDKEVNAVPTLNGAAVSEIWISSEPGRTEPGNGTFENPYDGSTQAKFDARMAAIPAFRHIHLGTGTFYTLRILPKENWIIEGAGKHLTTVSFPAGYCTKAEGPTLYRVIGSYTLIDYFSVRNLTIDCNRANQPVYINKAVGVSLYALRSKSNNADIINVRALGIWCNGRKATGNKSEGFPMNIEHGGSLSTTDRIVFDGCDVIDPRGYASAISAFSELGGTFTGAIRRCYVQNHPGGSCFSPAGGEIDFEVSNNYAYNCATGSTIDTGDHRNVRYYGNHFIKMHRTAVNMLGSRATYTNIAIHHNYFDMDVDAGNRVIGLVGSGTARDIQIYNNTIIQRSTWMPAMFVNAGTTGYVRDNIISEVIATDLSATSLAVWGNVTPDNVPLSLGRP